MAKKKTITRQEIITAFMHYVLENGEHPKSVYAFAKESKMSETEFYNSFGSFEAIEKNIFSVFFENTVELLEKNAEYSEFDAKNKLLSFYFTFFELLKANRSYVVYALNQHKNKLKTISMLGHLRKHFGKFIDDLDIETLDLKQEQLETIKEKAITELSWNQLLFTLKFWLEDGSPGFEKTDIFIEKAVNTSFELMDISPLKSVLDLGKFLFKEKFATAK